ncbi:DUF2062 domain-containing protein [Gemmobacter nectariphilus]|uniref:DUF2062 domain-containing protein n=1 Tax=Gemmobacter nectariphilus TaxID=220343 RepID=UPI0004859F91|nr:DUF2062 domain-containing protein [Gemmobacter nectariphilus]
MVFKRRESRPWSRVVLEFFWPRGGWKRASSYILHRLRRLPDSPERIARGVFAGVFVSFTPLFGFHFLSAAAVAWLYRGNIIAALLATFVGNPITFPIFATMSLETGYWLLGADYRLPLSAVMPAFGEAGAQISRNFMGLLHGAPTEWGSLHVFFTKVYLPYLVGAIIPGTIVGLMFQYASLPLIRAYQRLRSRKTIERVERRRAAQRIAMGNAEAADWQSLGGTDDGEDPDKT